MIFELETLDKVIEVDADDVELTGAAAGSAGFFTFTKAHTAVFVVAAKAVTRIERVTSTKGRT